MEIKVNKGKRIVGKTESVYEGTVSLEESGSFSSRKELDKFVEETTEKLNKAQELLLKEQEKLKKKGKAKKEEEAT